MSLLTNIFGVDDEQARGEKLDAQLAALNAQDYAPGGKYYTPENWEIVQAHEVTGKTGNVAQELNDSFAEGWNEGLQNEKNFVNGTFTGLLGAIPWSVWIVLGIAGFIYFGGLALVKRKVANA